MTTDDLRLRAEAIVKERRYDGEMYRVLVEFAQSGGSARDAQAVLLALLTNEEEHWDEDQEEAINGALDIVGGYCRPQVRIWEPLL